MSSEAEEKAVLRSQLVDGTRQVPIEAFQRWDVQRVRQFKACVAASKKVAANPRATITELKSQLNALSSFWH